MAETIAAVTNGCTEETGKMFEKVKVGVQG